MKKGTTKIIASILGGLSLAALLMANVFAASDGTMSLKTNVAKADAQACYAELVSCIKASGGAGTKNVCDATASGAKCVCGTASICQ